MESGKCAVLKLAFKLAGPKSLAQRGKVRPVFRGNGGGTRKAAVRFAERGGVANDSAAGKLISDGSGDSTRRSGQRNRALALGSRLSGGVEGCCLGASHRPRSCGITFKFTAEII